MAGADGARAVAGLREIARRTGNEDGAQRVAWTDTWIAARDWLRDELDGIDGRDRRARRGRQHLGDAARATTSAS